MYVASPGPGGTPALALKPVPGLRQLAIKYGTMDYIDSPIDFNNYVGVTYQRRFANGTNYVEDLRCFQSPCPCLHCRGIRAMAF
jgi:hypothetical protein